VVFTANQAGHTAVADLERTGVEVCRVIDARDGDDIARIRGRGGVRAVECADGRVIRCDLVVTAVGWTAPVGLITMTGGEAAYDADSGRFVPTALPDNVHATGGLVGDGTLAQLLEHGRAVGRAAAGHTAPAPALRPAPHMELFTGRTNGVVDFAEDVTSKDLRQAVAEGYDSIELVKRYTTVTMGPTQGKLEAMNAIAIVADATGKPIADVGTTTARPPYVPVSLGVLAGGNYQPVRRSPIHDWHVAHDAVPLVAGAWIRPDHYGDPAGEYKAAHTAAAVVLPKEQPFIEGASEALTAEPGKKHASV
jgi:sarcosine oxidase subunit alpha